MDRALRFVALCLAAAAAVLSSNANAPQVTVSFVTDALAPHADTGGDPGYLLGEDAGMVRPLPPSPAPSVSKQEPNPAPEDAVARSEKKWRFGSTKMLTR